MYNSAKLSFLLTMQKIKKELWEKTFNELDLALLPVVTVANADKTQYLTSFTEFYRYDYFIYFFFYYDQQISKNRLQ